MPRLSLIRSKFSIVGILNLTFIHALLHLFSYFPLSSFHLVNITDHFLGVKSNLKSRSGQGACSHGLSDLSGRLKRMGLKLSC